MQKTWIKKKQKAERDSQAKVKAERLAKLRDPQVLRGFRRMVIGDRVYNWRFHGSFVEIRRPDSGKWTVPMWQLQGFETEAAWLEEHKDCCRDGCCDPCFEYAVSPRDIRKYIDKNAGF